MKSISFPFLFLFSLLIVNSIYSQTSYKYTFYKGRYSSLMACILAKSIFILIFIFSSYVLNIWLLKPMAKIYYILHSRCNYIISYLKLYYSSLLYKFPSSI